MAGFKHLFFPAPPSPDLADVGFRERRKLVRLRCSYEVKVSYKDKKFKATVVDIGVQGLKLRTGQPLKVGDKLKLAAPSPISGTPSQPVEGKVAWVKSPGRSYLTYAGLVFTTSKEEMGQSWVKIFLKELGFTPKSIFTNRRFVRADCFLTCKFTIPESGRVVTQARVYNLGVGGMLLESPYDIPLKVPLEIEFAPPEGLSILTLVANPVKSVKDGKVRLIGFEFDDLSQPQLDILSKYLKKLLKANFSEQKQT